MGCCIPFATHGSFEELAGIYHEVLYIYFIALMELKINIRNSVFVPEIIPESFFWINDVK
jgi:hypothetical protein